MGEIINNVMYGILAVPVFVGVLYWIFTLIFSPIIVANNVLKGFIPTEKVKKAKVKKAKVKKEILEISKTTTTYDPRYRIEDTLNFVD